MPMVKLKPSALNLPTYLEVESKSKQGGEGCVYFSRDGRYAVKVYHRPHANREQFLAYIMQLFAALPPEQERFILPPLALIETFDNVPRVGFVMRRVDPTYDELLNFMLNPVLAAAQFKQGKTWGHYLRVTRSIANAICVLHGKGCAHTDIHFRNFLVNLDAGEAVMLETDGVVIQGFVPPSVKGLSGFMAPEILVDKVTPSEYTDRHSLAVLILHTLLLRNPMKPLIEYADDPSASEQLGWGKHAIFSEDHNDRRHRPRMVGVPLYQQGELSYRILTPVVQALTERALIQALRVPQDRPSAREWLEALACMQDELWNCHHCKQSFPYPNWVNPRMRRKCPFCGQRCVPPYPTVLALLEEKNRGNFQHTRRRVVLGHGDKLYADIAEPKQIMPPAHRTTPAIGEVVWDQKQGFHVLINVSTLIWRQADGGTINRGERVALCPGLYLRLGDGKRLIQVLE